MVNDEPWFRAKDVAAALGYANPHQAIRHNADERDRSQLKDLMVLKFSTISEDLGSPNTTRVPRSSFQNWSIFIDIVVPKKQRPRRFSGGLHRRSCPVFAEVVGIR